MKTNLPIKFYGDNGHNKKLVDKFNKIAKHFDVTEIPSLLESWMDNYDLDSFTTMLEERHYANFNEFVIEYNVRSLCGTKAYSAVILDVKAFGRDTFEDMMSYAKHELTEDGSIYYLEQDLEGRRADKGNQGIIYDRAWIRTPQEEYDFLRYLESNL